MKTLRREVRIFFTAVMFLTRLPVPRTTDHRPEYLREAPRYFPWVGLIVGLIAAGAYMVARLVFPPAIALVASMLASILATGAFHEDGFADVCDGFGGGWTKEKILAIMKDSRLGTFGVVGLVVLLGLKFLTLQALPASKLVGLFLLAHSASRVFPVAVMQVYAYAGDTDTSKSKDVTGRMKTSGILLALAALVIPALLLPPKYFLTLVPAAAVTYGMIRYFARWIGGYTGDCLGAIQQATELTIYLGAYIIIYR